MGTAVSALAGGSERNARAHGLDYEVSQSIVRATEPPLSVRFRADPFQSPLFRLVPGSRRLERRGSKTCARKDTDLLNHLGRVSQIVLPRVCCSLHLSRPTSGRLYRTTR